MGTSKLPEGCVETKPFGYHDFYAPAKGQTQSCLTCTKPKDEHIIYERIKIIGDHGNRFAWRIKESR
jgi:hypothetical protein